MAGGERPDLRFLLLCGVEDLPSLQAYRWTVLILAIAFPGFFHLLAWGQTSGLALLCFTLAYLALRRDHTLLAGLAIGSLIFKPQLGLAAAVVFVFAREWKVVAGAVMAASVQLAAAWMHYGTEVMRTYLHALLQVEDVLPLLEPRLYQTHSLRSFWSLLLPWPRVAFGLYVVSAVVILALAVRVWTSHSSLSIRFSALLLATVLVSPHLTVYDLVILAPAFLLLGDWALCTSRTTVRTADSAAPVSLLSLVPDGTVGADHSLAAFGDGDGGAVVDLLANIIALSQRQPTPHCHPERSLSIRLRMGVEEPAPSEVEGTPTICTLP